MPKMQSFKDAESYYGVLFHELIHATGHEKRLNRKGITEVKGVSVEPYSYEELIAEMGACFLKFMAGITTASNTEDSAAYLQSWIKKLNNDHKFVVIASAQSQRATDYILNIKYEEEKADTTDTTHVEQKSVTDDQPKPEPKNRTPKKPATKKAVKGKQTPKAKKAKR
jgi:antirestriction protein ArdC